MLVDVFISNAFPTQSCRRSKKPIIRIGYRQWSCFSWVVDRVALRVEHLCLFGETDEECFIELREVLSGLGVLQQYLQDAEEDLVHAFGGPPRFVWYTIWARRTIVGNPNGPFDFMNAWTPLVVCFFARAAVLVSSLEPSLAYALVSLLLCKCRLPVLLEILSTCSRVRGDHSVVVDHTADGFCFAWWFELA